MDVGDAAQDFFDAVLLQGAHAFFQRKRKQLGDPRMFLNGLLHRIGADQQFVQADAPAIAGAGTFFATHFFVQA